ncbi:MAG: aminoglycoside phosphotransferase family protein [Vicinamibacterales bacterium]
MTPAALDGARDVLAAAGVDGPFDVVRLTGGSNNRVFRVDGPAGRVLLKLYFDDPSRNRARAEFDFLQFAWEAGARRVPRPLACDPGQRLGVYEFVEGRPYVPGDVSQADVDAALELVLVINRHRREPDADALPVASDACVRGLDYLSSVERRLERLTAMPVTSAVHDEASAFVASEMLPAWRLVRQALLDGASAAGWDLERPLTGADRCLSPSDFGFHNALATPEGVRFLDFEYAGWDDPAKLVCDFFGHFEVPVPPAAFEVFAGAVAALFDTPAHVRARMDLVLPACRFKWCCISLNDFLPAVSARRSFADVGEADGSRGVTQLRKARAALAALTNTVH